jgi:hypothetical protein
MFPKLLAMTLFMIALAGGMLLMRQHRLELAHRAARTHAQAIETRQQLWTTQVEAASLISPESLKQHLSRTQLAMEPAVPQPLVGRSEMAGAAQ